MRWSALLTPEAGVPRIRFHDLLHVAATLVLDRLGYSDISMTSNRYSHVRMDTQSEATRRLVEQLVS